MLDPAAGGRDAPPPQVDVPGAGPISLVSLDGLREALRAEQAAADHMTREATGVTRRIEDRLADIGALLVPRRGWWRCRPQLAPWLDEAERLVDGISLLDAEIERVGARQPAPVWIGVVMRALGLDRLEQLQQSRVRAATELRRILVLIASQAGDDAAGVPDVGPMLVEAGELEAYADQLHDALSTALPRLGALSREVSLRSESWRRMGFDALYLAAHLTLNPPSPIRCPIDLEPGELVYLSTEATLARMAAAARRAGSRVPVEQTGITHWVGSLHDRPAAPDALVRHDEGTVVVTSYRLAFVGPRESLEVPIHEVLDLEVYLDGIAVARLGAEEPDFVGVRSPRQVAFYVNWAMSAARV